MSNGLTVVTMDDNGKMMKGVSFPRSLSLAAHKSGQCDTWCSFCFSESVRQFRRAQIAQIRDEQQHADLRN